MSKHDAIAQQILSEQGRKVTPSEVFKARLAELMGVAQQQADASGEDVLLKAAFLSDDEDDQLARARMKRLREQQKANGWKCVGLVLDPNQIAVIKARGGSQKLATSLERLINGLAVSPGGLEDLEPDEAPQAANDSLPDIEHRYAGTVLELWIMRDGSLDGRVRQGAAKGPRLSSLGFGALLGLWHLAQVSANQDDPAMVESYLDRRFPDWRETGTPVAQASAAAAEPYEVLGIPASSTFDEAKAAYRRALHAAHPDKGGSAWLFRAVQGAWAVIKAAEEARQEAAAEEARKAKKAA
jgi:hypothetical protein